MRGAIRWRLPLQLTALPALRPSGVASVIAPLLAKQDVLRTFFAFSLIIFRAGQASSVSFSRLSSQIFIFFISDLFVF